MGESNRLPYFLIDLMKSYINGDAPLDDKADVLVFEIGRQIVNCNANNEPTADLEYLYDTAEWLQSKILEE